MKVGQWYWCAKWIETHGGMGLEGNTPNRDWVVTYAQCVYVGENLAVMKYSDEWGSTEFSVDLWGKTAEHADQIMFFFRQELGFQWATADLGAKMEQMKEQHHNWVFCSLHGAYDPDELCWECHNA